MQINIAAIATLDKDFKIYRRYHTRPFERVFCLSKQLKDDLDIGRFDRLLICDCAINFGLMGVVLVFAIVPPPRDRSCLPPMCDRNAPMSMSEVGTVRSQNEI